MALTAYLPILNTEYHKSTSMEAGVITALYSIFCSVSRVMTGRLVDKYGGYACCLYGLSIILLGSIIIALICPGNMHSF